MKRNRLCPGILSLVLLLAVDVLTGALAQDKDKPPAQGAPGTSSLFGTLSLSNDQVAVFLIGYAASDNTSSAGVNQQATVVSITNLAESTSCPVSVDFRFGFGGSACTTTFTLAPGTPVGDTADHCTRSLPVDIARCNVECSPPLTFFEGKAVVSTTSECMNKIAVDARLYHTTGSDDLAVAGIADLKVIKLPQKNKLD